MVSKHHIIYIPGIGDHRTYYQPQILSIWRAYGVKVHYHPVIWRSQHESWNKKLNKLSNLIETLYDEGATVSLVGISAGASAALNAYAVNKDKLHAVVYICGKLRHPETIGRSYYDRNPAFETSLHEVQGVINKLTVKDKAKMLNVRPFFDETVPVAHTEIPGVRKLVMVSAYHVPSIFIAISLYGPLICGFIKRQHE